jgi:alkyl sulfatase BDS1-like metallo-beta-lactamase superfamily hydrolase
MSDRSQPKPPTDHTVRANAAAGATLALDDEGDWGRATRGLIATHETGAFDGPLGTAWDVAEYDFLRDSADAPASVHPSLWRQGRLNAVHGLFEVADGIWQCRGYDISNITFIAGTDGWIVVDPLTTATTAAACLEMANAHLGERPVTAVLYTHSHTDHYGGVLGVTSREAVDRGDVRILAPEGFLAEAVSENLIAGPIMGRRAFYQFGLLVPPGPLGHIDCGLGKTIPRAQSDLVAPTEEISVTGTELVVDGVRIVFQNTPGTEAPAEMNFLFPDHRSLCIAENCTHTLHNALPFRGAQVRNTLDWSKYIQEAIEIFGADTDTIFSTHNWPRFGADDVRRYLEQQRDLYRWLHDQSVRLMNHGNTPREIAEQLHLPDCFASQSHTRGYYGTISHNSKAVYQRYIGWYDGNPSNLHPHPPEESGARYVEAMGGADAVVARGRDAFAAGDYRWVCELLNHVVFADPTHTEARELLADGYEQLGYQSESGPWRDSYLMGAMELRTGMKGLGLGIRSVSDALTVEMLFDLVGIRLSSMAVEGRTATVNWHFTDVDERHVLGLDNCALHHRPDRVDDGAGVALATTKAALADLLRGDVDVDGFLAGATVDGDEREVRVILESLESFSGVFGIVEP